MNKRAFIRQTLIITYLLSTISFAFSQKPPKIYLYPEYFLPSISTSVRVDSPIQDLFPGTTLNLENDLGFDKSQGTLRFQAIAGSGSQVALSYLDISRHADAYLYRDIAFADTVYHAGANVNAYFNSQIFGASWRFAIINTPIVTAALSVGGRWMQAETGIKVQSGDIIYMRDKKAGVPVPLAGAHGSVYIIPRLLGRASVEYFHINTNGYEATAKDFRFSFEYYFLKNLGAGTAYSIMEYDVNRFPFNKDFSGEVNYSLKGFSAFIAVRF